jgi:preprotein translocase subunit SecB
VQLSSLQLEDYLLKELQFTLTSTLDAPPDGSVKYDALDVDIGAKTHVRSDNPRLWRCELTVLSKDENDGTYPYSFKLVYVGFFRVLDKVPSERIEQLAKTNAPALLYSAAREALLYLTGRGRSPAILLPSITFLEPPPKAAEKSGSKTATKPPAKKASSTKRIKFRAKK